jgi:hypothetical protein
MTSPSRTQLKEWSQQNKLYALADAYLNVPHPIPSQRLQFQDTDPQFFEMIAWNKVHYLAPTLLQVDPLTLSWLLNTVATERWGVFVVSRLDLPILGQHLQKFVIAKGPDQNPYFLRFHDAAVLEVLMSTWAAKERDIFTAPLEAIGYPDLQSLEVRIWKNEKLRHLPTAEDCLLTLSEEQLQLCSVAMNHDLIKIVYWHLRDHHARAVQYLEPVALERRVGVALGRARKYALQSIADLAGFAALMFELAPNFDEHPSFQHVLSGPGERKMSLLSQVISDREWSEALSGYDREFWLKNK